jgi:23S rRNA (guanosine2251-2'-O)-methyltransferase
VARHFRRNEGKPSGEHGAKAWAPATDRSGPRGPRRSAAAAPAPDWLWGWHAVTAALANPARGAPRRLVASADRSRELAARFPDLPAAEVLDGADIARLLPAGAAHQGVALKAAPIESWALADLARPAAGVLVMLDQVTDPQNVGAVFRSAAAFGARGVILQDRHAPPFTGALAKAAAGALDVTPHARVVNLARALDELERLGWRAVGLAGDASDPLDAVLDARPVVLVLGSEGEGLRRLVGEHCDTLARIAMPGGFESLNVAAAAAVALYEATRPRR